jgi:hypothetical protein
MSEATQTVKINNVGINFKIDFYIDVNMTDMAYSWQRSPGEQEIVTLKYRFEAVDLKYSTEMTATQNMSFEKGMFTISLEDVGLSYDKVRIDMVPIINGTEISDDQVLVH